jgi:two-component system sensor histidine kinase YesM
LKLRGKLSMLFLATIVLPLTLILVSVPTFYHRSMKDQAVHLADGTLTAVTHNIEMYLDDLERLTITPYMNDEVLSALKLKASKQYTEAVPYRKMQAERALIYTLPNQMSNSRKDLLGTVLLTFDGNLYVNTPMFLPFNIDNYPYRNKEWVNKTLQADGNITFIGTHTQDYAPEGSQRSVFSVARVIKDPDSGQRLSVMMADADTVILQRIIKDINFNLGSTVVIWDENNQLIFSDHPVVKDVFMQLVEGQEFMMSDSDVLIPVRNSLAPSKWKIAVLLSSNAISSKVRWVYVACYAFAGCGLMVVSLLYFTLSRWMVAPFKRMIQVMKRVQRGEMETRVSVRGRDEVAQLGYALNQMIVQVKDLIDREYRAELRKREAEYNALQSQIQPHFLYNTLNGFMALNRIGKSAQLEEAILSLSGMLRYTLEHNEWTTLGEEFGFLKQYCELQRIRFEERLKVTIEVDKETEHLKIPKLLLQPLVENAIIHGIEPKDGPGHLRLRSQIVAVKPSEFRFRITIDDDGVGFAQEVEGTKESVGLLNVKERLRIAYANANLSVRSDSGQGTEVIVEIPMEHYNRDRQLA